VLLQILGPKFRILGTVLSPSRGLRLSEIKSRWKVAINVEYRLYNRRIPKPWVLAVRHLALLGSDY
jgi:hypothetical protein